MNCQYVSIKKFLFCELLFIRFTVCDIVKLVGGDAMNNRNINEVFGKRLKELRENKGLYQEDIGEWFKMGKSTVSQWESGRLPHATIIVELAEKFNVTTDDLLGVSRNSKNTETIAAHRTGNNMDDLPPEAIERVEEFIELMKIKHGKKSN